MPVNPVDVQFIGEPKVEVRGFSACNDLLLDQKPMVVPSNEVDTNGNSAIRFPLESV